MRRRLLARLLPVLLTLAGCVSAPQPQPGPVGPPQGRYQDQLHRLPVAQADGSTRLILMRLCRPPREGPAPLVVINHGSPGQAAARQGMRPGSCESAAVQWFLARGYAAALPLRRGYGTDGGTWPESYGRCERPDFVGGGRETARDIAATISYARTLPEIRRDVGALVVGQSAGGWGAVALGSTWAEGVAGLVNFAGGRAGRIAGVPNANCRPDLLVAAARQFGATARGLPMLWIYAANDSFFAPEQVARMHAAYVGAGGRAELHALGPFGQDGHALFGARAGAAIWGPILLAYMRARGLPAEP
ncbi:MAG TPA: hypothetical protein VD970_08685 [Acetobacteraceae bacterium]|nr:hypothetical protein [Acetobacteraceae bacterium]